MGDDGNQEELSRLLSSAGLILLGVVLAASASLIERVIIGRAFGPSQYGEVSIGIALMSLASMLSLVGFDRGVPRYVSRFDSDRDVRGIWLTGLSFSLVSAGIVTVVLFENVAFVSRHLTSGTGSPGLLRLFVLGIPLAVGLRISVGVIRGMENTRYKTYANDLLYPGTRIAFLAAFIYAGFGIYSAGYAYLVAGAVTLVATHLLLGRIFDLLGPIVSHARELVRFSAPLAFSALLSVLLTRTDTLMLGFFRGTYEVGIYSAAYPLANVLLAILSSFGYLYLPVASRLDTEGELDEINGIYQITTKWVFVLTFPLFLTFAAFSGDVLSIVFGSEYRTGSLAFVILSLGFFTNAAAGRNRKTLTALGHTYHVLLSDVLTYGLNIALNLLLIPRYGFVGASIATAAAFVVRNAAIYVLLRSMTGITPFSEHNTRTFVVVSALLVPLAGAASVVLSLTVVTLPAFLLGAALLTAVVVAVTGCLQAEDRVAVEFVEDLTGVQLPLVHDYLPR